MRGWSLIEDLILDSRLGLRQLRKNLGFTAVAVLTLALGIGANTAIFTLVHAVMMKRLPVADSDQLYILGDTKVCCDTAEFQDNFALYSYPLYKRVRENTPEFSEIAAFQTWLQPFSARRTGVQTVAEPYNGYFVSGNYFSTLGLSAFAGRTLSPEDDQPNAPPVAMMMSYRAWQLRYGADPSVIGATFTLNGVPATIVGVTPPGFFGETLRSDPPDFWAPLATEPMLSRDNPLLDQPTEYWLYAIGRLRLAAQPARAQTRLTTEVQQWFRDQGGVSVRYGQEISKVRVILTAAGSGVGRLRNSYGDGLRLLMVVSALVLLIACANVANLLLARGMATRSQTAVRVALGASRARLMRQMLTEGTLLALLGGIAGIGVAFAGTRAILALAFRGAKYVPIDASPSLPVLVFAFLLSLLTGIIFSVAPTWVTAATQPAESLRGAGRSTRDHSVLPQKALVILQAAMSLVLLVGAGLLTESLAHLESQQLGLETQSRLIVRINPALAGYTSERLPVLYRDLEDRFSQLPGVRSASLALHSPMDNWNWNSVVFIEGRTPAANPDNDTAEYDFVSPLYFETIGTRLLRGRTIDVQDTPNSHHVAVINEAFAHRFFPNEDAIGKHLGMNDVSHSGDYEIVGIVENTKYREPKAPAQPMFFIPLLQTVHYKASTDNAYQIWGNYIDSIQLRVAGRPENFEAAVRQTLANIDPNMTVIKMLKFEDQVGRGLDSPRLIARLTTLYAILAVILASIGLYGVAAYMVARRTTEIGIRIALGAPRANVVAIVLRSAMAPIASGLLIGVPVALGGGRAIASQLFGVRGYDPLVLSTAIAALTISAVLAAIIPARRAASIDPLRALRLE
ncbi:MAG: ABC transporter permease [Candidatus Acidiferrales bacterium]